MKRGIMYLAAGALCAGLFAGGQAQASSHREAPSTSADPAAAQQSQSPINQFWRYILEMFGSSQAQHRDPPRIQVLR